MASKATAKNRGLEQGHGQFSREEDYCLFWILCLILWIAKVLASPDFFTTNDWRFFTEFRRVFSF